MAFKTIHTKYGLIALSRAESSGTPIQLIEMAVGDGGGNPVVPDWQQTGLVRERYRSSINRVYQDPNDPTQFTAELVVPQSAGGFVMREIGIFDSSGSLFAVGNLPEVYKPTAEEGSFGDAVLRLAFVVSNAEVVTIMVDPNMAMASQAWVINNMTAAMIIPGGTVGQLLGKKSNGNGDYEWQNPDAISVTVDTVAEKQLLAEGQTVVDLAITTTYGLAVYVDGLRLDMGSMPGEWQPDPILSTRLTLGQSYAAGTRITLVQNEPAGSAPAPLERAKNLSDVESKATARQNIEVYSRAEVNERVRQPGDIFYTAADTPPKFSLKANGAAISRTAYAALFARIGTRYGVGDGFSTFNLPDLRGEFIRGWDDGRGVDGGRALGSQQTGSLQSHAHSGSSNSAGSHTHVGKAESGGVHNHEATSSESGGHNHTANTDTQGEHSHTVSGRRDTEGHDALTKSADRGTSTVSTSSDGAHSHTVNVDTGGSHTHSVSVGNGGTHGHDLSIDAGGRHNHTITINATGGAETRPRNIALLACIAF